MTPRTVHSFSRALEFVSEPELVKRMGCGRHDWLIAALKELVDNALDACEEHGIAPGVAVTVAGCSLTVADNGPGMSAELVERLCERDQRTSAREAYAAPDRGSQGNALPVIMALGFGFGRESSGLTITSQGVEHVIVLRVNRLEQRIDLERDARPVPERPGTTVSLEWPEEIDEDEVRDLLARHSWLNPHATFRVNDEPACSVGTAVEKWPAGAPTPPHWYTPQRFAHRVLLEIKRDPALTVAQFLAAFRGLTLSTRRSAVAAEAGLSRAPLSALLDASGTALDEARAGALLAAMQAASRPPKPAALGGVGKETVAVWAANHASGDLQLFTYTAIDGEEGGVPWRVELGFALLGGEGRQLLIGQNFAPAIEPLAMLAAVLPSIPWTLGHDEPIGLYVHRITPARQTLDYGKSRLNVGWHEATEVRRALERIAQPWIKHRHAQERGRKPRLPAAPKPERVTFQDAAFGVMAAAWRAASSDGAYPVLSQQVFYAARPKILELIGKDELGTGERSRFCYVLLPMFQQQFPELTAGWRILYKPRGELIEPHTYRRVGLGTREVATYHRGWTNGIYLAAAEVELGGWAPFTSGPRNRYGAVIIVEKGGIADVLRQVGLDRRHDVAIVGNEGQSVEAELKLIDACGAAGVPVFLLTDFDRQGFTIAENLRAGTWRHRYVTPPKIVHIGLRLEQINNLGGLASAQPGGLEDEPIGENARKHVSDARLRECGATEDEIKVLRTRRVELNAFSTEQIVDMTEGSLAEHGIAKVIPNAEDLTAAWRAAHVHGEVVVALQRANARALRRWREAEAPTDLEERIKDLLEQDPTLSWNDALRQVVEDR